MSSADLLRECGRRLTDANLWRIFHERFHRQITLYVIRTILMLRGKTEPALVCDLVQDVYYRLLKNNGSILSGFRGETDFSALAFLGRTTMGIVSDYFRSQQADKRRPAEIVSFEHARREEASRDTPADLDVTSILEWIDVQRLIDSEPDRRHATRNVLIFKLHYVEGLTVREISQYPGFHLTEGAIEVILKNLRNELRRRMGR
ncbi:MAG TPA: sigma-70 family RNA polymerase sigma factor [Terriglobia bacterium]|nr:sigma-70 family RNA polymerase sigma factor [Terriglobia bacterium]